MNIALDYDGTFTSDPDLWCTFIHQSLIRGHKVYVVTMRYASECEDFHPLLKYWNLPVVATGKDNDRYAKRKACEELGINIHIWIDDNPEAVYKNASEIWSEHAPEGQPVVPHYE